MAIFLRRLMILSLALVVAGGMAVQVVPASLIQDMGACAATADTCGGPQPPCNGHTLNCAGHVGCITMSALPATAVLFPVAIEWMSLDYDRAPQALAGISVKPELSPPILAA
jgi:hypothetical protein